MKGEFELTEARPEVSVIVPVYNVNPYLRRCVDSLITQTLHDIEIILIDDGSTDGCSQTCDDYASMDARIRVVHQANAGLSEARNAGINMARADYLMFVDSDDCVEPEFCRIPLSIAKEQKADLVMFQYRYIKKGKTREPDTAVNEGEKTQLEALTLLTKGIGMTAWNKLYHRDLFRTNRYPKGCVYADVFLTPVLVHDAKTIFYTPAILYNQWYRIGSITTIRSESNAADQYSAFMMTVRRLKEWGYPELSERYHQKKALSFVAAGWNVPKLNEKCLCYLRSLKHCPSYFSLKQRCCYYLCMISPSLCRLVYACYRFLRR
jgi:glycosyltransferase involved in cell wall biosynthesis